MHWLWTILMGLVIGAFAKLIMPGKDPGGFIVTILLGIAGSIVATWLGRVDRLVSGGTVCRFHHVGGWGDATPRHLSRDAKRFRLRFNEVFCPGSP